MKELKYETKDDLICITPCPYDNTCDIGSHYCISCNAFVWKIREHNTVICKGDELYINKKGISQNKGMVMESKNTDSEKEKDPKKVIAALRGEITKKNKRILKAEKIMDYLQGKLDEKTDLILYMDRFYRKRNIFQRIFNKHYEK